MIKLLSTIATVSLLSGCVAVWGDTHKETSLGKQGVMYEFDTLLQNIPEIYVLATKHCAKYDRVAIIDGGSMPHDLMGIDTFHFRCVNEDKIENKIVN